MMKVKGKTLDAKNTIDRELLKIRAISETLIELGCNTGGPMGIGALADEPLETLCNGFAFILQDSAETIENTLLQDNKTDKEVSPCQ
jgi:hypothetical protein